MPHPRSASLVRRAARMRRLRRQHEDDRLPHGAPGASVEEPADETELRLTVEPLHPERPRSRLPLGRRALLNGLSIAAACALLLLAIGYFRNTDIVTRRGLSSGTPTPSMPPPPHGWTLAGPAEAQTIAFAASEPATAYTCGAFPLDAPGRPLGITVGVSHDYGRTWAELSSPLLSPWCDISINPTDARDVALLTVVCASCSADPLLNLYRTTDGGVTWTLWLLPPSAAGVSTDFTGYRWAWAGSTLFIAPVARGQQRFDVLAASVAQRPFAWVRHSALFAGEPPDASIVGLIGLQGTLFATLDCGSACPVTGAHTLRTDDGGATWSRFAPELSGDPVYVSSQRNSSAVLFGFVEPGSATPATRAPYVESSDLGRDWRPLPAFPGTGALGALSLSAAPDGTVYAALWSCCGPPDPLAPEGVYRLAPGAAAWSYLGPLPGDADGPLALSWTQDGHPQALWAGAYKPSGQYDVLPGIERHLP